MLPVSVFVYQFFVVCLSVCFISAAVIAAGCVSIPNGAGLGDSARTADFEKDKQKAEAAIRQMLHQTTTITIPYHRLVVVRIQQSIVRG